MSSFFKYLYQVLLITCGMIVSLCLKSCKPMLFISTPSTNILPVLYSNIRNKPSDKLLLPAPISKLKRHYDIKLNKN